MIYVMSDVHGCEARYRDILRQIRLTAEDRLYILGDVIDRHPGGLHILRHTMKDPRITLLLGNHERMMLEALTQPGFSQEGWLRGRKNPPAGAGGFLRNSLSCNEQTQCTGRVRIIAPSPMVGKCVSGCSTNGN